MKGNKLSEKPSLHQHSAMTSNQIHLRNPYVVLWWSFAFPGYGHFIIGNKFWGFLLMSFEYLMNNLGHINLAIFYSMTGQIDLAKMTLNKEWVMIYITIYIFSAWDSYRRTVELNSFYHVISHSKTLIQTYSFGAMEINILEKKKPYIAVVWSFLLPGLGYFYLNKMISFIFSATWWVIVAIYSGMLIGLYYSLTGHIELARKSINLEWLLFTPSMYGFALYNTYQSSVEVNKMFKVAQTRYFAKFYQKYSLNTLFSKGD